MSDGAGFAGGEGAVFAPPMDHVTTVLVVDDHPVVADGIATLIGAESDLRVVGAVGTLAAARAVVATEPVDVVLMDLHLPDGGGVEGVREVRRLSPTTQVVVLTAHADDTVLLDAVEAGCTGFLMKSGPSTDVIAAIRAAAVGEALMAPGVITRLLPHLRPPEPTVGTDLTPREREVLRYLGEGLANAEIGDRLGVSVHTIRNHVQNILAKLGVHSKLEALAVAVKANLV
jgi:DNA-binding NarL/FixJ family response regulator